MLSCRRMLEWVGLSAAGGPAVLGMLMPSQPACAAPGPATRAQEAKAVPGKKSAVLVGAIRYSPWLGGQGRACDMYSLTPAKWNSRLPYYAKVYNDASRLKRINASAGEVIYRADDDILGYLAHAAFDEEASFGVAADVTFSVSVDGKTYKELEPLCRLIAGTTNWSKAVYWNYLNTTHSGPALAGARYLKVRITGARADSPQLMRLEFNYRDGKTKVIDEFQDFSKMYAHTPNLAVETARPERFRMVEGDECQQRVFDEQILYAKRAGLDFWANGDSPKLPCGAHTFYDLLQASPHRDKINFCIIAGGHKEEVEPWSQRATRYVGYFKRSNYQKVMNGRPLVFVHQGIDKEQIDQLRTLSRKTGAGSPYILGRGDGLDGPWLWAGGEGPIPTVSLGRNDVPRHENPPPWGHCGWDDPIPSTAAIVERLDRKIRDIQAHPDTYPAQSVMIYAWDENAEGGWMVPTWTPSGPNTERVDALHEYFYRTKQPKMEKR